MKKRGFSNVWLAMAAGFLMLTSVSCGDNAKAKETQVGEDDAPVISSFSVSPANITAASTVTLSWSVDGADTLEIDQGVGDVTGEDGTTVHAAATTTYTLTATGDGGTATAQATVTLVPPGTVYTPVISPGAGTYEGHVTVSITCGTGDADMFYTLDGSDPSDQSTPYTASFTIDTVGVTTVKAIAVKAGMTDSAIASVQYTVTDEPVEKFVADHTVARETVLRSIPDAYINTARTTLHVAYNHTSHGRQVSYGVYGLPGFKAGDSTKFGVTCNAATPDPAKLNIRDNQISGTYSDLSTADADWATWREQVRTYLNNAANAHINVMMWSWCDIAGHNVANYLSSMQTLIDEYGEGGSKIGTGTGKTRTLPVTFIFMTGHANGNNNAGAGKPRDQAKLITDYCTARGYYCIDYYAIDSHAMDDTYYEDVNDNAASTLYGGNFYEDWQADHSLGTDWYYNRQTPGGTLNCSDGHNTQHITANRKAFAFWWVLARIAGYGG